MPDERLDGRSKRLSTPGDEAAADRKHLACLVILRYSSEPAISAGSGMCQISLNLLHTNTDVQTCVNLPNE